MKRRRSTMAALAALALLPAAPGGAQAPESLRGAQPQEFARGEPSHAETIHAEPIHGVVRSAHDVTVGSDAGSRILELPLREGAAFRKGELLVAFDCARTRAEWRSAQAEQRGHEVTLHNAGELAKLHAAGRNDVEIARAAVDKASAAVEGWQARVDACEIRAPFDGRVADVFAHVFDLPAPTAPILRIVDPASLEVEMLLPSRAAAKVVPGTSFTLAVEETGARVRGRVARVGAAVDPVSQTLKVVGTLDLPRSGPAVLPGMSGRAEFAAEF